MIRCPSCQKENADEAKHCGFCGSQLQAPAAKRTMFGMPALPPDELERLRSLQAAKVPAPKPTPVAAPKPAPIAAPKPAPKPADPLGGLDLGLPGGDDWNVDDSWGSSDALGAGLELDLKLPSAAPEEVIAFAETVDTPLDQLKSKAAAQGGAARSAPAPPAAAEGKQTIMGMGFDQNKLRAAVQSKASPPPRPVEPAPLAEPLSDPHLVVVPESIMESFIDMPATRDIRETAPLGYGSPGQELLGGELEPEPVRLVTSEPPATPPLPAPAPAPAPPSAQVLPADAAGPAPRRPAPRVAPAAESGGGGSKVVLIAIVVVVILGLIGAAVAAFMLFGGKGESPDVESSVGPEVTQVRVRVPSSLGAATVAFGDERVALEAGGLATFKLDNASLSVGDNSYAITVTPDGEEPVRLPWSILLPARVEHDLSGFERGERDYQLRVAVPTGARLTLQGRTIEDAPARTEGGVDHYALAVDTSDAWRTAVASERPEVRHRVFYTVRFEQEGQERVAEGDYSVTLRFPRCALIVSGPPPRWVVDRDAITLTGLSAPGGEVQITNASASAAVGDDGRFSLSATLTQRGEQTLHLAAQREGCLPERVSVPLRRVSTAELRELNLQGRQSATEFLQHNKARLTAQRGEGLPAGTPVRLQGKLQGFVRDGELAVLLVNACQDTPCLVGVQTGAEIPLDLGQELVAVGFAQGARSFRTPGEEGAREVPMMRSQTLYAM